MLMNAAEQVVYRRNRYWDASEGKLGKSIIDRRLREYMRACEVLIEIGTNRLSDSTLAYFGGDKAVAERDKLLGASADVVPFKRRGRPR